MSKDNNDIKLVRGGKYNFKHQPERLKYIGLERNWHQFELVGKQGVWCELLDTDLHMIEETKDNNGMPDEIFVAKDNNGYEEGEWWGFDPEIEDTTPVTSYTKTSTNNDKRDRLIEAVKRIKGTLTDDTKVQVRVSDVLEIINKVMK